MINSDKIDPDKIDPDKLVVALADIVRPEEESSETTASCSDVPVTDPPLSVDSASGPAESSAPAAALVPTASANEALIGPKEEGVPKETSSVAAPEVTKTVAAPGESAAPSPKESAISMAADPIRGVGGDEFSNRAEGTKTPDILGNGLPPAGGGVVDQSAETDDGGCWEPFIPPPPAPPAPTPVAKPKPRSFMPVIDQVLRDWDFELPPSEIPETAPPAAAEAAATDGAETVPATDVPAAPADAQLPPPRFATAFELFTWIRRILLAKTTLSRDQAGLVTFWIMGSWFQEALSVRPCLLFTGRADVVDRVLHVLNNLCPHAARLAGIRRSHLGALQGFRTYLVSEPNLDRRTAELLSSLTDQNIVTVQGSAWGRFSKSTAVYAGENPETYKIQNSIPIHIAPTNAPLAPSPKWLLAMMARVPVHLKQYRERNLDQVCKWTWEPSGLPSETAMIAEQLGRSIVDARGLRLKLVALLKTQDQQRLSDMSDTIEAIVLEAIRTLIRNGKDHAYAKDVAAAVNQLREARGETARVRPEQIGHLLKRLDLPTHRLSQFGNGLRFDKATLDQIQQLCAMYGLEDTPMGDENLHNSQAAENTAG